MTAAADHHDGVERCAVAVVGGGPAGLMAAYFAAGRGLRTVLLEKNERPGLKILISGGGRCNVTTTKSGADLEAQFGQRRGRFLRHALRAFPPTALRELLEAAGVALREEDLDKVFPVSQRARDVLDALLRLARNAGAELRTCAGLCELRRAHDGGFDLVTARGPLHASRVVLATGGLSYPKTGATGDGYELCRALGHTITPTVPGLAPLRVDEAWVRALQGIVLHDVDLDVLDATGRTVTRRRRPILFTHRGLSGPAPMDLAGDVEELGGAELRFDFAPAVNREELERSWLQAAASRGAQKLESLLPAHLPERLRAALVDRADAAGTIANLSRPARQRLLRAVKDLRLFVPSSLGYPHAEVTRGGVALDEIDARTMQSKLVPGLFVCGELLDLDGPIGGFNFQSAFATGRLAGLST
ncbi:MAG: NAD(P)/FAD-dependent oxidoreductase [Planctomycetes bacterium]|nr:NAD(P)/FAD-dependent oxidoreductase [Planctomycetota bacterium]